MRYGISMPCFIPEGAASANDMLRFTDWAAAAEAAGWDGFFIWDHMLFWKPTRLHIFDPWVLLTAIAARTQTIKLGPMVTPIPRRRPWKLARETMSLDHFSNGRLILGVGLGAPTEMDYTPFGEPSDNKILAQRLDEGLEILTGLWSGQPVSFNGQQFTLDDVTFLPKTVQQPRIPIWVAALWPRKAPMRRAARWDGVFPITMRNDQFSVTTPDDVREMSAYIASQRSSSTPFDFVVSGNTRTMPLQEAREIVDGYQAAGTTWWVEGIDWLSGGTPDDVLGLIAQGPPR